MRHSLLFRLAIAVVLAVSLALAGAACSRSGPVWSDGATPTPTSVPTPTADGGAPDQPDEPDPGRPGGAPDDSGDGADSPGGPADLPAGWPASLPVPDGATLVESHPATAESPSIYLYLRVNGDLEATLKALAGKFTSTGYSRPEQDLNESAGRLRTTGHGHEVLVDTRVNDDNMNVLDMTYQVTPVS